MSVKIMSNVWSTRGFLDACEKLVLLKIADCAADDGSHAYPSLSTIAGECGMGRRGVIKVIKRLTEKGVLLKQIRTKASGSLTSNYYTINIELLNSHIPSPPTSPKKEGGGSERGALGVVNEVHYPSEPGAPYPSLEPSFINPCHSSSEYIGEALDNLPNGMDGMKDEMASEVQDLWQKVKRLGTAETVFRGWIRKHGIEAVNTCYRDVLDDKSASNKGAVLTHRLKTEWKGFNRKPAVVKPQQPKPQRQQQSQSNVPSVDETMTMLYGR